MKVEVSVLPTNLALIYSKTYLESISDASILQNCHAQHNLLLCKSTSEQQIEDAKKIVKSIPSCGKCYVIKDIKMPMNFLAQFLHINSLLTEQKFIYLKKFS